MREYCVYYCNLFLVPSANYLNIFPFFMRHCNIYNVIGTGLTGSFGDVGCSRCTVIKSPPYEVTESGYGSFECRIFVYMYKKGDSHKLEFVHDLVLSLDKTDEPIVCSRFEKLTFQRPSEEFAQRLLRAGGVSGNC